MSLRDQIQDDIDTVILNTGDFAESVTYTDADGADTVMNAVVMRGILTYLDGSDGTAESHPVDVFVSLTDLTQPARGDEITVVAPATGTETYRVDAWRYQEGGWMLHCLRLADREIGGTGQRMRRA
jgi:hypothetical protein